MALDRTETLRKAEKLLRQGRLDAAIAEYVRIVEAQPRDWNTASALGDLYVRAAQADKAAAEYMRIADHFAREGLDPQAATLYRKVLKIAPDHEPAQVQLADVSARLGLLADAKSLLKAVAARRRGYGDHAGTTEIMLRLGSIDPSDVEARLAAARAAEEAGDVPGAIARFQEIYKDLLDIGRTADALPVLADAVRLNPGDRRGRAELARAAIGAGDIETAGRYLDRQTAGRDPLLLMALVDIELHTGRLEEARGVLLEMLEIDSALRPRVAERAWTLAARSPDAAYVCLDAVVDASIAAAEFADAAAVLQEFIARVPLPIPALRRLVQVCADGGLEGAMSDAQAQLADAYLASEHPAEARVIAEDLVAREPWESAHLQRFRRALMMLGVSDPDTVIAERLGGQKPFTATEVFTDADGSAAAPPPAAAAPSPVVPTRAPATQTATPPIAPPRAVEIDLTPVLGGLQSAHSAGQRPGAPARQNLDDVFEDLRQDVMKQKGPDQAAQLMALARTYLEMGMADDAISALRTAARSPRQRFEAGTTLGRLFRERGDVPHAIEWMERAAEAPAPSADEGRALLYDLGVMLEDAGETARALAVFLELQADADEYRDVARRVDRLSRVQTGG